MIRDEKRKVIQTLYQEGRGKKEIARLLRLDPKTVRSILVQTDPALAKARSDKICLNPDLLREVYERCQGYVQRIHEVLVEEHRIRVGYSTLSRMIRELEIGMKASNRCHHVPDVPGEEMQQDTTVYRLMIGGKNVRVVCSGLYLRYSKMRYIKFYLSFNRFKMKCFFHEALIYWGYAAKVCVIDNTNLAILHGTGNQAVFNPEMVIFVKSYGFTWLAHEKGHANRKAGKERNFWTVETNFLPGRTFQSMEDLNQQAFQWATDRYAKRPQSKTRLIPIQLFEEEKPDLIQLAPFVEAPYQDHDRDTDQYGYIEFQANFYWIPGTSREQLKVIEYPDRIEIFKKHTRLIQYPLPPSGTKNEKIKPEGVNPNEPKNRKKHCAEEEKRLRALGEVTSRYLDFIQSQQSHVKQKPRFIRDLYELSQKMAEPLFLETIQRAMTYRVAQIETLVRISRQLMKTDLYELPGISTHHDYVERESYRQGRFSQSPDLTQYKRLLEEE